VTDSEVANYANQFSNAINAVAQPVVIAGNLISGNKDGGSPISIPTGSNYCQLQACR
jgi:hypothetical protein